MKDCFSAMKSATRPSKSLTVRKMGRSTAFALAAALVALPSAAHAAFVITLNYDSSVTTSQRAVFAQAKQIWESIIPGYLPGITLGGITIDASIPAIDGAGGILGSAGPTQTVNQGGFTLATNGRMRFDSADVAGLQADGSFNDVILHEMCHVFGFGTLWNANGVYVNGSGVFLGQNANAAFRSEYNQPLAAGAPVELTGGAGTANGHWRDTAAFSDRQGRPLSRELMTGYLDAPTYISSMTVASLRDIGFATNPVPEPATMVAMAAGLVGFAARRRRRAR